LLMSHRITFCRYADDYCLFCDTKSDAYRALVLLSQKLFIEGLGLQKKKTKILTAAEHLDTGKLLDPADSPKPISDEDKLLKISIRFDPYSANEILSIVVDDGFVQAAACWDLTPSMN
jgi:hypothetical protein